jgi:hypothetical protein
VHKRELAAALVDGCVELSSSSAGSSSAGSSTVGSSSAGSSSAGSSSGVLGWSRAATPLRVQADVAQAKRGFELAHAARVERGTHARTSARHPRRWRRGSCGGRSGRTCSRGRAPMLFAGALRAFVGAQGRETHQAHPPRRRAGDPCETQWVIRMAAAARTWTGTRAATVAKRPWFWVKKTRSRRRLGAPQRGRRDGAATAATAVTAAAAAAGGGFSRTPRGLLRGGGGGWGLLAGARRSVRPRAAA